LFLIALRNNAKKIVPEIEISLTIFFQGTRFASSSQKNLRNTNHPKRNCVSNFA
jgi:hypothetical protein